MARNVAYEKTALWRIRFDAENGDQRALIV